MLKDLPHLEGFNSSLAQSVGELCWCKILQQKVAHAVFEMFL